MQTMQPAGTPQRRTERARHLALILVVMFLPATTLYSQIIGHGTTIFAALYMVVMIGCLAVGRLMDVPPVAEHTPAWDPPSLSGE